MSQQNLNDTTPAAPVGGVNVKWQGDSNNPRNISAYVDLTSAGGIDEQSGTSYTVPAADINKLLLFSSGSAVACTLPAATSAGFGVGFYFAVKAGGAGTVTVTPTTSTINGASSLALTAGEWALVWSDGTNYFACVSSAGGGSGPSFADNENVSGSGTAWTLANTPSPAASMRVYINLAVGRLELIPGTDFTLTGGTGPGFTTLASYSSGALYAYYRY